MSAPRIIFDSGVIDQIVTNNAFRRVVNELLQAGWLPTVPTPVLAEAITGTRTDASANQALARIGTTTTGEGVARLAGALRYQTTRVASRRVPSAIDAIVAAHAVDAGNAVVFTTDPSDLRRLLADHSAIRVERPLT